MPFRRHLHYAYMGLHFIFKTGKHIDCQKNTKIHASLLYSKKEGCFFVGVSSLVGKQGLIYGNGTHVKSLQRK